MSVVKLFYPLNWVHESITAYIMVNACKGYQ